MRTALRPLAALLTLLLTALAVPAVSATATPSGRYQHYVALGDSFASGPGIPEPTGSPPGCGRSTASYPAVLAGWLRPAAFTDATCGGAQTTHMAGPQQVSGGVNPPQLDALRPGTDLVTLTIGGNDIGFGEILSTCGRLAAADPSGAPCQAHYTAGGTDVLAERIDEVADEVAAVLAQIRQRSPRATVLVVGYLRILPPRTGCWPLVPFAAGDTPYFDRTQRGLNQALAQVARKAKARFVDPYRPSRGHDACAAPDRRWVEPLQPASPAAPVHPNAKGMAVTAGLAWLAASIPRWFGW